MARAGQLPERDHRAEIEGARAPLRSRPAPGRAPLDTLLGVGRGGREAVDPDPVSGQVHGGGPGEVEKTALAGAVADVAGLALMAGGGDDHDDAARSSLLHHEARNVLG